MGLKIYLMKLSQVILYPKNTFITMNISIYLLIAYEKVNCFTGQK